MHDKHSLRLRVSSGFSSFASGIELDWSQFLDWNEIENENSQTNYIQTDSDSEQPSEPVRRRRKRRKVNKKKHVSQLFKITASIADLLPSLKTEEISHKNDMS